MSTSFKALLLSALIYPGAGHFYLRKRGLGALFASLACIPLVYIVSGIIAKTNQVIDAVLSGDVAVDMLAITDALTNITSANEAQLFNIQVYSLLVIWVLSALDAYRLGASINRQ